MAGTLRGFDSHRLHFFGRCCKPWRDDAAGRLDVGLAVYAKLGDEDVQECLGLLGLVLREDLVEPVGVRTSVPGRVRA